MTQMLPSNREEPKSLWSRLLIYGVSGVLFALTLLPGIDPDARDSFPFSTFPMFARPRGAPTLHKVEAVDAKGNAEPVDPALIGGSELLQTKVMISRAVRRGRRGMAALCQTVAERAADNSAVEFRILEVRHDPVGYFEAQPPLESRILYRCAADGTAL